VGDAVRDVAQEELLAPGHARVPDDQHVDRRLLRDLKDRHRGIIVHDHAREGAVAGELLRELAELGRRGARAGGRRLSRLARRRVLHEDDLQDEQLRGVAVGHVGRPANGSVGRLRPVGRDHHPLHRPGAIGSVASRRHRTAL
jgi:hypothetical protein